MFRSLKEIIFGGPPPTVALHGDSRWKLGQTVRYMIQSIPEKFDPETVSKILSDGFEGWRVAGNLPLVFQEVPIGHDCEIRVAWTQDSFIDSFIAGSDFPPNRNGEPNRMLFNSALDWTDPGKKGTYDIRMVTLHEIGHAIGLDHSTSSQPVMSDSIGAGAGHGLTQADDDAAMMLYTLKIGRKLARALRFVFSLGVIPRRPPIACGRLPETHHAKADLCR
jgi:hypothetical protein